MGAILFPELQVTKSRPTLRLDRLLFRHSRPVLLLSLLTLTGCQSWHKSHLAAIQSYSSGDLKTSQIELQKSIKSPRAEKEMLLLDQAVLQLASGNPSAAESNLREVRRELEHLEQTAIGEKATSMLTDDNAVAWAARDFERHMVLNMLLLSSLLNNGTDSFAYSMQVAQRAAGVREGLAKKAVPPAQPADGAPVTAGPSILPAGYSGANPSLTTSVQNLVTPVEKPIAMGSYLSAAIQSETATRATDTDRALDDVRFWNPDFGSSLGSPDSLSFGTRCKPGHGALHVIALVGRAPEWVPESTVPTQAALLIADRILSITGKHTLPPTIAPVQIARPMPSYSAVQPAALRFSVLSEDNQPAISSIPFQTLVDVNAAALASFENNRDEEVARIVVRRVVKKGTIYVLKEAQKVSRNTAVDLAVNVAGIAWEAMEKPDLRSWHLLPARIDVARTELPEGTWKTDLQVGSGIGGRVQVPVHIADGRNTFVVFFVPENSITGDILVGGADQATHSSRQ